MPTYYDYDLAGDIDIAICIQDGMVYPTIEKMTPQGHSVPLVGSGVGATFEAKFGGPFFDCTTLVFLMTGTVLEGGKLAVNLSTTNEDCSGLNLGSGGYTYLQFQEINLEIDLVNSPAVCV